MLSRGNRLNRTLVAEVMTSGRYFALGPLAVKTLKRGTEQTKFAIVVPKKVVKLAVDRHCHQRRIRALVRVSLPKIKTGWGVVVLVRFSLAQLNHLELNKLITQLFTKASLV